MESKYWVFTNLLFLWFLGILRILTWLKFFPVTFFTDELSINELDCNEVNRFQLEEFDLKKGESDVNLLV